MRRSWLAFALVLGCQDPSPPPPVKSAPAAEAGGPASEASASASEAAEAAEVVLRRAIPGTDWAREGDLIGRVRKVTTRQTTTVGGARKTRVEVLEFTATGQQANAWHDGQPSETARFDEAGNVVERVSVARDAKALTRTTRNLAFDAAGRVLERQIELMGSDGERHGQTISYRYDEQGRVLSERYVSTGGANEGREYETSYTYDEDGDWLTRTEAEGTEVREVELDGPRKIMTTVKSEDLVLTETFDRATGRLLANQVSISDSHLAYVYGEIDDHGNWLKVTVQREHPEGEVEWIAEVERSIEYYP